MKKMSLEIKKLKFEHLVTIQITEIGCIDPSNFYEAHCLLHLADFSRYTENCYTMPQFCK
jgi:hypothetical protein